MLRRELRTKAMGVRALLQHQTITGALALALCLVALLATGSGQAYALGEVYRADEVIVKLRPGVAIEEILADYPSAERLDEDLPYNLETRNIYLLKAPDDTDVETFAENLLTNKRVDGIAEPNFVAEAPEDPADPTYGVARMKARSISYRKQSSEANDTFATNLNLSCARDIKGATVTVLDTGTQLSHPKLEANFKGVKRYDFVDNDTKPSDKRVGLDEDGDDLKDELAGHGTHVAGIVDQVAPGAKIMPLRVLDSEGYGDVYTIARAIAYAERHEVDVINLSLGTSKHSELLEEMVEEATGNGIVVAAAAGNSGIEEEHYPAAGEYGTGGVDPLTPPRDGLLAVTSVDENGVKSDFATYGKWVDISAPGELIRSTFPRDKYANWTGTSMATPFISGQAALIRMVNGSITPMTIEEKIQGSARPLRFGVMEDENDPQLIGKLGAGHANVCDSL